MTTSVATFKEAVATQFGHKMTVSNQKGDWTLYGKGPPPGVERNTEVEFEATKNEKGFWTYTNLRPHGTGHQAGAGRPAGAAQSRPPNGNPDAEAIFVTGIVGRSMGSGKFDATDIKLLTLAAAEAYGAWMKGGGGDGGPPTAANPFG